MESTPWFRMGNYKLHPEYGHLKKPARIRINMAHKSGWICQLCKTEIKTLLELTIDHIVPKNKGGGDDSMNLQIAHAACNEFKGDSMYEITPETYLTNLGKVYARQARFVAKIKPASKTFNQIRQPKEVKKEPSPKKVVPLPYELRGIDYGTDYCMELYNEIVRSGNGMTRMSYVMFKEHFEKYRIVQNKNAVRLPTSKKITECLTCGETLKETERFCSQACEAIY